MTLDRAGALKAERDIAVDFLQTLTDEQWRAPSRCEGWAVRDVVAHMGAASKGFFTPWVVGLMFSKDVEKHNDRDAAKRAAWSNEKVLAEYVKWSKPAGTFLKVLQAPGLGAVPLPLAEVGAYPGRLFASAICFDTGLHLRYDIASAIGRESEVPPRGAEAVKVSAEWMVRGIPVMSEERLTWLDRPVELQLVGDGATTWTIHPAGKKGRVSVSEGPASSPAATVVGDAATFPVWGTGRESWREHGVVVKSGDEAVGTKLLDSLRII